MQAGILDAGICGYDWIVESGSDVHEVRMHACDACTLVRMCTSAHVRMCVSVRMRWWTHQMPVMHTARAWVQHAAMVCQGGVHASWLPPLHHAT